MAPVTPHWQQPSHPEIQQVLTSGDAESFLTKSISKIKLPPFGLFAKLDFPPCTPAPMPTYATVQMGRDSHLNLNSDLLYINHSCDPSLIFDTANLAVIAGPRGLEVGDELTFFYPSTEWSMSQPFSCFCGSPSCKGTISGAKDMAPSQLEGLFLNGHIRELLAEQQAQGVEREGDKTAEALRAALAQAEKAVEAARAALNSYVESVKGDKNTKKGGVLNGVNGYHGNGENGNGLAKEGLQRRGPTSRELSGEMGGDTIAA
ncbi:post-SET domain-protein [Podospora australis]|uniref:Post-SET domain-protein n=1 Tax=Podospora australis TaxID=1536484 RepID=A0AAN6WZP5_9PEZI|nr:post-SET domain-protein [Podospora australis]